MSSYPSSMPPSSPTAVDKSGPPWKWIFGCSVAALLLGGLCIAGLVAMMVAFSGEPEGLLVEVDYPWSVTLGETFDVTFQLRNVGEEPLFVEDIDLDEPLDDSFLDGCVVVSSDPPIEKDYSLDGIKSFLYDTTIDPGDSHTVVFTVEAQAEGQWGGPVAVYAGHLAARKNISILVRPEGVGPLEKEDG